MELEEDSDNQSTGFEAVIDDSEYQAGRTDGESDPEISCSVIQADIGDELIINAIHGDSNLPQKWDALLEVGHISDAKLLTNKTETGMCYTLGKTSYSTFLFQGQYLKVLLDIGTFCSCTSASFLDISYPSWRNYLLPVPRAKFSSCNSSMKPLGIISMPLVFPHSKGSLRLNVEFLV